MYCECKPLLMGFQVLPASSVRKAPAAEIAMGIARIENNRVQAHAAGAGLPFGTRAVAAKAGELVPGLASVFRTENGSVFDARVDGVCFRERRLDVPDALEFPRMLGAIVKLMRRERRTRFGGSVVD